MQQVLRAYLRRLTDLSTNNRSLLLNRLLTGQMVDVHSFDMELGESSYTIIDSLIAGKSSIALTSEVDARDQEANRLSQKLKKIDRLDQFLWEERGSRDLCIGWPFVRGKFMDDTMVRCPLLYFPVSLHTDGGRWYLEPRTEIPIVFNKTFLLAYALYNDVKLDEELVEMTFEDFDKDSRVFRTNLYQVLKDSPVTLHFNQELFVDQLQSFHDLTRKEMGASEETGKLRLFSEAVLGIFPQAGSFLVPDYLDLMEKGHYEDVEEFFASRTAVNRPESAEREKLALQQIREEHTFTPLKLDAHQENVIKAVKTGHSLVVQGPPGSGKSQLICNLIADFAARGKRVLLVCQKRAALDVVHQRLSNIGLGDFSALVHDFKNDRKALYEQINSQIERIREYQQKNNSLDAIQLERGFLQASRQVDQITEELDEFRFALFDESEAGVSIKELYLSSDPTEKAIHLKQEYKNIRFPDEAAAFSRKLKAYGRYASRFNRIGYAWYDRISFKDRQVSDLSVMREMIAEIPAYQAQLKERTSPIIKGGIDFVEAEVILSRWKQLRALVETLETPVVYEYFRYMSDFMDRDTDLLWLANMERVISECFRGAGPETSLSTKDLGHFQGVLNQRKEANNNALKMARWSLFSKEKAYLKQVRGANGLADNPDYLSILEERIDNRLNLEHNLSKLKAAKWLKEVPEVYDLKQIQEWFFLQRKAAGAKVIFSGLRNFKEYFPVKQLSYEQLSSKIEQLLAAIDGLVEVKAGWLAYLSHFQIHRLLQNEELRDKLIKSLNEDFDSLTEFDRLKEELEADERRIIEKIEEQVGNEDIDLMLHVFDNSLKLAWIEHIETKYPVLRAVSSLRLSSQVSDLQQHLSDKYAASKDMVLMKVRERSYENAEYNRLNNMVTYRDLQHQVTKKRQIWPLRKLMEQLSGEIFELVPCWLASPETVSAVFPMEQMFDLVIFDEASQCFAEKGLPAMYRGRQVVITGDSQQLQPNDLYRVKWEEGEDVAELEVESLLDLARQHLWQLQLSGHYRSQTLDLIDFSNRKFYGRKLSLLPARADANRNEPGISYLKTEGNWNGRTNAEEATRVVSLIRELKKTDPEGSIGVVTFNTHQRELILDMLEKNDVNTTGLFVKNVENVQGDERDTIIFSIGYAADESGRVPLLFGSLNRQHGENRLNVAVTRARKKVYVVCSFLPEQLKVEDSHSAGARMLKAYLQYAHEVSEGRFVPSQPAAEEHRRGWFLKQKLQEANTKTSGYELTTELPFSDLTVKGEDGRYHGLILTDDDLYYQSVSIKDPHAYTPFTLDRKGWRHRRVFSREYWMGRDNLEVNLLRFIEQK
ncbi:DEAD/DEAH box helicase [Roseivirga sp. BDSF3-8]|uniref:DEAD/DEAH box helicase n=1 Tax=Roseivirga sp. BDSF3-8 TaxID=3241598 RepID=UPI003532023D